MQLSLKHTLILSLNIVSIQFKIICVVLFTIQSLQSSFTVSTIYIYLFAVSRAPHLYSDAVLVSAGFLLLGSSQPLYFLSGVLIMGVAHAVITVKGTHLASHGTLSESPAWADFWAVFFIEVRFAADGK